MRWILLVLALFGSVNVAHANPIIGTTWQTSDGSARVKIVACKNGTPCGKIVWINPNSRSMNDRNNPKSALRNKTSIYDRNNPRRALRKRKLVGLPILWGFSKNGNEWSNGKIYNPKNGKTYKSHISLQPNGILKVKGCVGPFCLSQKWTKVK